MKKYSKNYSIHIAPCDPLNPEFGYALRITDAKIDKTYLHIQTDPLTGKSLDADMCLMLAQVYLKYPDHEWG